MSPKSDTQTRAEAARSIRIEAADIAAARAPVTHVANGDEDRFDNGSGVPTYIASFTKGLPHNRETGIVLPGEPFKLFKQSIEEPTPENFKLVPLGPEKNSDGNRFSSGIARVNLRENRVRAWESTGAGMAFDLEGPDAQAVTIPPAPSLLGDELVTEMMENYWMGLLRDVPFSEFDTHPDVKAAIESLNNSPWLNVDPATVSTAEKRRIRVKGNAPLTAQTIFRGNTRGEIVGPYLSQFLLVGNAGIAGVHDLSDGIIQYGGMSMDQRVRIAEPKRDFMTTWESYLDVQNAADVRGAEPYVTVQGAINIANGVKNSSRVADASRATGPGSELYRFIYTPRDLATWVHHDALYQAYLNACLIMQSMRIPFDSGIPFQDPDEIDHQTGFAVFGFPHIQTLVTEVATRALKAARYQKFNVHRRGRPERIAALIERYDKEPTSPLYRAAEHIYSTINKDKSGLFDRIRAHNAEQNTKTDSFEVRREDMNTPIPEPIPRSNDFSPTGASNETLLLPMAFPEGSPMHPSYAAGHATVAGACVTVLKAYFDHTHELPFTYVPHNHGRGLRNIYRKNNPLIVEHELNKLAANISIGRNWSGVHWYTDYRESLELGEDVALGILEEQMLTYGETFSMTVPLFDGKHQVKLSVEDGCVKREMQPIEC